MTGTDIGILHPGAMGAQVGAQAAGAGARVWWLPQGRGAHSAERAGAAGLRPAASVAELAGTCRIILSVCPPAAALEVARLVAATAFGGIYVDANAISPAHARAVAELFGTRAQVVDGGIVGGPPVGPGTRLYLSGPREAAEEVSAVFEPTLLQPRVLEGPVGQASALKLAFASFNKISYLLAAQSFALADAHGVLSELVSLAGHAAPGTLLAKPEQVTNAGPRAWRWGPEITEIAQALTAQGLPGDVADSAALLFTRWAELKDTADPTLEQLISALHDD
ncbi:NAD(P)-dependent oxidoreductase [Actinospica durhamensis]|uniref:NAD(P)-dependent oxidoreductase n=1 Tax=Actinospica durhamensis TaxID=1508375 RepID=A0A941EL85_9ACTN|nr:NAD(P)-dependent oxidoreductase [Actinospica durhamensis]MBR7832960.1 NAD(P)-dependent oxidoreductase [Actinospica durhamensis]